MSLKLNQYTEFGEVEGHLSELNDVNLGWFHLHGNNLQRDLDAFVSQYDAAVGIEKGMTDGTINDAEAKTAAVGFLRQAYRNLPSELAEKMKTYGWVYNYDNFVRPPLAP